MSSTAKSANNRTNDTNSSTNKKRTLIVTAAIILLCLTIIVGVTYALFTDGEQVRNHLQAGDLEIRLTRTDLEYRYLTAQGVWQTVTVDDDLPLTNATADNVFGLDSGDIVIVPGTYFNADLKIENVGNVAFNYFVSIDLLGETNELADQLIVTITYPDKDPVTKKLSEMINGHTVMVGTMLEGDAAQTFNIDVYFKEDTNAINNTAQTQLAEFDLIVSATQIPPPARASE